MNVAPNQVGIPYGGGGSSQSKELPDGAIVSSKGSALANGKGEIIVNK